MHMKEALGIILVVLVWSSAAQAETINISCASGELAYGAIQETDDYLGFCCWSGSQWNLVGWSDGLATPDTLTCQLSDDDENLYWITSYDSITCYLYGYYPYTIGGGQDSWGENPYSVPLEVFTGEGEHYLEGPWDEGFGFPAQIYLDATDSTGSNEIWGGNSLEYIYLGDYGDYAHAGAGDDTILGGDSSDEMYGSSGDDLLLGYGGNDLMDGGSGDDYLDYCLFGGGCDGYDRCEGGKGYDICGCNIEYYCES